MCQWAKPSTRSRKSSAVSTIDPLCCAQHNESIVESAEVVGRDPNDPIITVAAKALRAGGHGFRACGYVINGVSDRAEKWVNALEAAAPRRDLRYLTPLPLRYELPDHLFRRRRAWCALCFDQWRTSEQEVYEPLLRAIKASPHCPVHARPLDCTCRHCARRLSPLGVLSRPGRCERCDGRFGARASDNNQAVPGPPSGKDEMWPCNQVGGLLAMLPQVNPVATRETIRAVTWLSTSSRSQATMSLPWHNWFGVHIAFRIAGWTVQRFLGWRTCCESAGS